MAVSTLNKVSLVSREILEFSAAFAEGREKAPNSRATINALPDQVPRGNLLMAGLDGNTSAKCKSFRRNGSNERNYQRPLTANLITWRAEDVRPKLSRQEAEAKPSEGYRERFNGDAGRSACAFGVYY